MADDVTKETGETETPAPAAETKEVVETTEEPSVADLVKEIKELRNENANRRVKGKQYEAAFDGYDDEQVEAWLSLASTYKDDPKAAAADMKALVDQVLAEQEEEGITQTEGMTRKEVEQMIKAQADEIRLSQDVAKIEAEAVALGYNPKSEDLDTRLDYEDLCRVALTLPETATLEDAHKVLEARKQKIIDGYIKSKGNDASRTPTAPAAGGSAVSQERANGEAKTLDDVFEKAVNRFKTKNSQV